MKNELFFLLTFKTFHVRIFILIVKNLWVINIKTLILICLNVNNTVIILKEIKRIEILNLSIALKEFIITFLNIYVKNIY